MGLMLMYRDNLWTVTGALSRATWEHVWRHVHAYCTFVDYNWDLTLKQTLIRTSFGGDGEGDQESEEVRQLLEPSYLSGGVDFAAHLGTIGKGMTFGEEIPEEEIKLELGKAEAAFYRRTDNRTVTSTRVGSLHGLHSGLGGWSAPHQSHCLDVATMHGYVTPVGYEREPLQ